MKDLLSYRPRNSANGLAGLLLASGVPFDEALIQGSAIAAQQASADAYQQQVEAQRQRAIQEQEDMLARRAKLAQLGQFFKENPDASPTAGAGMLFESGVVEPQNIAGLAGLFGRGNADIVVKDPISGANVIVSKKNGQITGVRPLEGAEMMPQGVQMPEDMNFMDNNIQMNNDYPANEREIQPENIRQGQNEFLDFASQRVQPRALTEDERKKASKVFYDYRQDVIEPSEKAIPDAEAEIKNIRKALKHFKPGFGADRRKSIAEFAEFVGADNAKGADGLTTAAAAQLLDKSSKRLAFQIAKSIFGARITDADLRAVEESVPNRNMSPLAIEEVIKGEEARLKKMKERNKLAPKYFSKYKDISEFDTVFREYNDSRAQNVPLGQPEQSEIKLNAQGIPVIIIDGQEYTQQELQELAK